MSSGTLHFPAILVTVTCHPRRCVCTPLSRLERKVGFPIGRLGVRRGSLLCLHTRLPFSESSAGPPTTSVISGRRDLLQAPGPTNVRCKASHLIKIILAYSPKKERADPIEDGSEVQQGHFCPPPFSQSRTWTLPLIQLPAGKLKRPLQRMEVWIGRLGVRRGSLMCLHTRLPFSESSTGPPTTSVIPGRRGLLQAPGPTNVRCKASHLIKIILAYSPKKERADPIEDGSEVQQGHFCPPPFSQSRTWTLPLIQLPTGKLKRPLQRMGVWLN
ncbi:hypothetical protein C5167_041869 [Papaver somniferum]|nr:hypothetical protein C5167_041869 [Papaver somniferum]